MKKNNKTFILKYIAFISIMAGVIILLLQAIQYGSFFTPSDFLHHENFALILVFFSLGILTSLFIIFGYKHRKGKKK